MKGLSAENLIGMGYQARRENRHAEALGLFRAAVDRCRRLNDRFLLAQSLTGLGQIERDLQNSDAALDRYQEAVEILRDLDCPIRLAHTVRHVGDIFRNREQLDLAAPCYAEALEIYRGHGETTQMDLANTLRGYALLKDGLGDRAAARAFWHEAGTLYAAVNVQAGVEESQRQLARLAG
jgi:tetratricopeptide (TPR) repeat protein